jgi:isopenicillin-N N-acyltransferase-like protein
MPLEKLILTGTPFERGVTHGREFESEIRNNVETYLARFAEHGLPESEARSLAVEYIPLFKDVHADFASEMKGIAEGSGLPLEEVALINARYELIYAAFSSETDEEDSEEPRDTDVDGCTSFGLQPEITADGHTYIGQNWDWIRDLTENIFVMDIRRDEKPNVVALTEAGIATGRKGVNEHGIGFVANGLVTPQDGENRRRKPYMVRCREILDAERLDTALEPIVATNRVCSTNFLVGHATGEMINIEAAPETANYLYPEDGILTHANHFEDQTNVQSEFEKIIPHTLYRASRMERLLSQARSNGPLDTPAMCSALRDHFSRPSSICRHVDEDLPERRHNQTIASLVLDLNQRTMLATQGPPCETEYQTFTVAE